jgi:hypothetical protein
MEIIGWQGGWLLLGHGFVTSDMSAIIPALLVTVVLFITDAAVASIIGIVHKFAASSVEKTCVLYTGSIC